MIRRNLLNNELGLRAPLALPLALMISGTAVHGADRVPNLWGPPIGALYCVLFLCADHRLFVFNPSGKIVADRWQIILSFAGFRWTRDKEYRHFFYTGDIGSGKTSGMNGLLEALMRHNSTLGGVVIANKGEEYFYLEGLAKKYGRDNDLVHLRPRLAGESEKPIHGINVTRDVRYHGRTESDRRKEFL